MPEENNLSENTPPEIPPIENQPPEKKPRPKESMSFKVAFVLVAFTIVLAMFMAGLSGVLGLQGNLRTQVSTTAVECTDSDVTITSTDGFNFVDDDATGEVNVEALGADEDEAISEAEQNAEDQLGALMVEREGLFPAWSLATAMNDRAQTKAIDDCIDQDEDDCTPDYESDTNQVSDPVLICELTTTNEDDDGAPIFMWEATGDCYWEINATLACIPIPTLTPPPDDEEDDEPDPSDDLNDEEDDESDDDLLSCIFPAEDADSQEDRSVTEKITVGGGGFGTHTYRTTASNRAKDYARRNACKAVTATEDNPDGQEICTTNSVKDYAAEQLRLKTKCGGECVIKNYDYTCNVNGPTYPEEESTVTIDGVSQIRIEAQVEFRVTCFPFCIYPKYTTLKSFPTVNGERTMDEEGHNEHDEHGDNNLEVSTVVAYDEGEEIECGWPSDEEDCTARVIINREVILTRDDSSTIHDAENDNSFYQYEFVKWNCDVEYVVLPTNRDVEGEGEEHVIGIKMPANEDAAVVKCTADYKLNPEAERIAIAEEDEEED